MTAATSTERAALSRATAAMSYKSTGMMTSSRARYAPIWADKTRKIMLDLKLVVHRIRTTVPFVSQVEQCKGAYISIIVIIFICN